MRANTGEPVVLFDDEPARLERTTVSEDAVQRLVFEHPEVLPVADLDEEFAPPVPIGREVGTAAGPIDALYVSPHGGLTVVEAKLWRNPEARREVLGQVVHYASALATWSYEDLDTVCRARSGQTLWELAWAAGADDERRFVDSVAKNLRDGRMLLLVVGDGIREDVEAMADYLQHTPQLHYRLALVELALFEDAARGLRVAVPSVVAQTREVVRAVVRVDVAPQANVDVSVTVPQDDSPASRSRLSREEVLSAMARRVPPSTVEFVRRALGQFDADPRFVVQDRLSSSVVVKVLNPRGGAPFTVLVLDTDGTAYPGWLHQQAVKAGIPTADLLTFPARLAEIFGVPLKQGSVDTLSDRLPLAALQEEWSAVSRAIEELAEAIHLERA
ncbi:hypothetical protein [Isoptericola sp. b408]|uniref:hypothetical protein n=1 Tax=Isoptericola sp. b408 TaxID=3064653 RepID=UPI00271257E2|nr:hypothetical protein [Isoptericola sp. b408]MDO8152308.1 hypothetical protein [Isoptericola sp. b408]